MDGDGGHSPQRRRKGRLTDASVADVGNHDRIGSEHLRVRARVLLEGSAPLFLAFHNDAHRARGRPWNAHHRRVDDDPGLVVGGTAAVEPPRTFGGFERRTAPSDSSPPGWTS